jgi:hypothetical protein
LPDASDGPTSLQGGLPAPSSQAPGDIPCTGGTDGQAVVHEVLNSSSQKLDCLAVDSETGGTTAEEAADVAEATPETPKRLGRALYDWLGGDDGDLNLTRGEVVTITDVLPGYGWWSGAIDSETGIFPRCYVSLHKAVSS